MISPPHTELQSFTVNPLYLPFKALSFIIITNSASLGCIDSNKSISIRSFFAIGKLLPTESSTNHLNVDVLLNKTYVFQKKIAVLLSRTIVFIENETQGSPRWSGMLWGELWEGLGELWGSSRKLYI